MDCMSSTIIITIASVSYAYGCNDSSILHFITATIGEWNFGLYRGVALSQGWISTNRAHFVHNKVSLIEGMSLRQGWPL